MLENSELGIIVLTHKKPEQTERLFRALNRVFDSPSIVCHNDFSQCQINTSVFPANVSFVEKFVKTKWATFSIVEATMAALKKMYENGNGPEYFTIISGADYPVKKSAFVLEDLKRDSCDVHIDCRTVLDHRFESDFEKLCFDRYRAVKISYSVITSSLIHSKRIYYLRHPFFTRLFSPFSKKFICCAGSHWFSGSRRAAEYLIEFYRKNQKIVKYYSKLHLPEESFFQTIFGNAKSLRIKNENWRYIDWSEGGAHPKTLAYKDFPAITASKAHFARKVDPEVDCVLLDELDTLLFRSSSK